jgi:hypothetical protein
MSGIEQRLREAYQDGAEAVRPGSIRPAALLQPVRKQASARRRFATFAPLAAAVAVVAVVIGVLAVPRPPARQSAVPLPPTAAGQPRYLAVVQLSESSATSLTVQTAGTGHVTGTVPAPHGQTWESVAATGSDTEFIAAAGTSCTTYLYILTLSGSGQPATVTPMDMVIGARLAGERSLAASADGRTIGYAAAPCISSGKTVNPVMSVGVVSARGTRRQWSLPAGMFPSSVSLSADGSKLAYIDHVPPDGPGAAWLLPISAPSGKAHAVSRKLKAATSTSSVQSIALSPDGTTAYVLAAAGIGPNTLTLTAQQAAAGALPLTLHSWGNVPVILTPTVTAGGGQLLVWGIYRPIQHGFQVDPASGRTTSLAVYVPPGEVPLVIAW